MLEHIQELLELHIMFNIKKKIVFININLFNKKIDQLLNNKTKRIRKLSKQKVEIKALKEKVKT